MEDFTSQNLELVLGVKEGTNFDRVQKPTIVIATLNGQCLETKKIQSDSNPQYSTDLVWETNKNSLRKMRCNQTPIKVECYAVNENGSREKLGYILLSVRCAQIIHKNESNMKTNWHNILGVRNDFNHCKPRLLLYLIIREKDSRMIRTLSKGQDHLQPLNAFDNDITPIWLQEERLIQLGPIDTCHEIFLLNITADHAKNISQLLQDFGEFSDCDLTFCYNILNVPIRLQSFKIISDKIFLKEKVIVKIRTSVPILANYLISKPHFCVSLKKGNITLVQSEVSLKSLLSTAPSEEYTQVNKFDSSSMEHCCILKNKRDLKNGEEISKLSYLKLNIRLQYIESKNNSNDRTGSQFNHSPSSHPTKNEVSSTINLYNPENHVNFVSKHMGSNSHPNILQSYEKCNDEKLCLSSSNEIIKCSEFENNKSTDLKSCTLRNDDKCTESHRSYCLNVHLNTVKFLDSKPDIKSIEFRFYYQHGELISAISNDVSIAQEQTVHLKNVHCKLHLISSPTEIEELLTIFAPKINICEVAHSNRKCIAQTSLNVKRLFSEKKKFECRYETPITDCQSHKEIGFLDVTLHLQDHTLSTLNEIREGFSAEVDNSLAYKIVDELETWKERQKEIFKEELRKKEEAHLTLLNEEWQKRRKHLETKLASSIQQCQTLASNLNKTMENLRLRKMQSLEKETQLIQTNEQLQWKYDRKVHQLQDALQNIHGDFTTKLFDLEEQNKNLISQVKKLSEEKLELERIKTEQVVKLESYKKVYLTEDQTTSVLQQLKNLEEKLDNAQKSKSFFKEQWGKAVQEIHRIKKENQEAIESQIKNCKDELDNLDLEEILHADSAALTYDQIALNQIQREIDILNPDSVVQLSKDCVDDELFVPQSEICMNSNRDLVKSDFSTTSSSGSDRRLNMLLEERDTLLRSGTYTNDDSIIINLNSEIRSRLMN